MKKPTRDSRRNFLKATGSAALVAPYILSNPSVLASSPADKLRMASIGTSIYANRFKTKGDRPGRGAVIGHTAATFGEMVACADVNRRSAEFFAKNYNGNCKVYTDYRELLARDDIDAVTIGTPDHWHVKIAIDALRAGKHVYCEKPLSLTIREGQQACAVAKESDRVFQIGTQQRSEFEQVFLKAVAIAQSGMLGDKLDCLISIETAQTGGPFKNTPCPDYIDWNMWLGQAPEVPYCPQRADFDFRWWYEYAGGQVTDWGAHHGDIAMWAMGMDQSGPTSIVSNAKVKIPQIANGFNVPSQFDLACEFEGGHKARIFSGNNELIIKGDKGKIRVNRRGLSGKPAEDLGVAHKVGQPAGSEGTGGEGPQWLQDKVNQLCKDKKPGSHMGNFVDCIKNGGQPISDVFSHHRSISLCHLANISLRLGRKVNWDPKNETFPGDDQANAMVSRKQREGFEIDVKV